MLPRYDEWKTTDPRDCEPTFTKCPICKARHYTHERCDETEIEYEYQDREDD